MSNVWSIDCETIPGPTQSLQGLRQKDFELLEKCIEADRQVVPANRQFIDKRLTDPAKIDAAIQAKLAQGAQLSRDNDALDPMTAVPVCIVCVPVDLNAKDMGVDIKAFDPLIMEKTQKFFKTFTGDHIPSFYDWARAEVNQFLGFNLINFDLRVLRMHQAKTTTGQVAQVQALRWKAIDLIDELGDKWDRAKYATPHTLKNWVATLLNQESQHEGPVKEYLTSDFTGADVGRAYMENRMPKIVRHCTLDALMVALIAVKMGIC